MGYQYNIFCDSCNYGVDDIIVGDAKHAIAVCTRCREIRNPEIAPFRIEIPHCTACGSALRLERPGFCLRCNAPLRYKQIIHFTPIPQDRYPAIGTLVHARPSARRNEWQVPTLWLRHGKLSIAHVPEDAVNRVIEAELTKISKDAEGWVSSIDLAFVRGTAIDRSKPYEVVP